MRRLTYRKTEVDGISSEPRKTLNTKFFTVNPEFSKPNEKIINEKTADMPKTQSQTQTQNQIQNTKIFKNRPGRILFDTDEREDNRIGNICLLFSPVLLLITILIPTYNALHNVGILSTAFCMWVGISVKIMVYANYFSRKIKEKREVYKEFKEKIGNSKTSKIIESGKNCEPEKMKKIFMNL